jgi:coiled-coil domain-containing protein 12
MSDRAARLALLRAKAGKPSAAPPAPADKSLKFRNYSAKDEALGGDAPEQQEEEEEEGPASKKSRVEKSAVALALEKAQSSAPKQATAAAPVVPKKANWDLKRDVAPALERLEKRTQRAVIQLLRERLEREAEEEEGDLD